MSGPYHNVKRQRSRKVTHFTEDVSMKALNDPLLPHHPSTPDPQPLKKGSLFRYYDIDLSKLVPARSSSVPHRATEPDTRPTPSHQTDRVSEASKPDQIDHYEELPMRFQLSHETRQLLKEVDNISRMYRGKKAGELMDLDLSYKNRSEETSQASSEKENDSKSDNKYESGYSNDFKLVSSMSNRSKPVSSGFAEASKKKRHRVVMEIDDHFVTYGRSSRHSVKRASPESKKSELATSLKFARLDYEEFLKKPEPETKKVETSSAKFDHGVNQVSDPKSVAISRIIHSPELSKNKEEKTALVSAKPSSDAKSWQANTETVTKQPQIEAKEPLPLGRQENIQENNRDQVPGQVDPKRKENEGPTYKQVKSVLKNTQAKVGALETKGGNQNRKVQHLADVDEVEAPKTEAEDRPWRKNMKKLEDHAPAPSTPEKCDKRQSHDPEKVRQYMKAKRARLVAAKKARQKADEKMRAEIKERLLALEIQRRKDAKATPETNPASVEVKETQRRDRLKEEEHLRNLLVRLTEEMKDKYLTGEDPLAEMIGRSSRAARKDTLLFGGKSDSQNYHDNYSEGKNAESPPVLGSARQRSIPRMSSRSPKRTSKFREAVPTKSATPTKKSSLKIRAHKTQLSKNDLELFFGVKTPEKQSAKKSLPVQRSTLSPNRQSFQSPQNKKTTSPSRKPPSPTRKSTSVNSRKLGKETNKKSPNKIEGENADNLIHQNLVDNYLKFAELMRKKSATSRGAGQAQPHINPKGESTAALQINSTRDYDDMVSLHRKDDKSRKSKYSAADNSSFKTVEQDNKARVEGSQPKHSNIDSSVRAQTDNAKKCLTKQTQTLVREEQNLLEDHTYRQQTPKNETKMLQKAEILEKCPSSSHYHSKVNPMVENNFNAQTNVQEAESRQSTYASLSLASEKEPELINNSPPAATSQKKPSIQELLSKELRSQLEEYQRRSKDKQSSKSKSKSDQQISNSVEKQLRLGVEHQSKSRSKSNEIPVQDLRSNLEQFQARHSEVLNSMGKSSDHLVMQDLRSNLEQVRPIKDSSLRSKSQSGQVPYQDLRSNEPQFELNPGEGNSQPKSDPVSSQGLRSNLDKFQVYPNEEHRSRILSKSNQVPSRDENSIVERSQVRIQERELTPLCKSKGEQVPQNLGSPPEKIDIGVSIVESRAVPGASQDLRSHLEEFQHRQKEDMKMMKQCNLDIVLPPEPNYLIQSNSSGSINNNNNLHKSHSKPSLDSNQLNLISHKSSLTAKEIRASTGDRSNVAGPAGSSEAESQPPILHFADSPEPDPFNFMSSVKRKLQDQNRNDNPVENGPSGNPVENLASVSMALSEGPLSVTSHSSSKKSVDKNQSRSMEKEKSKTKRPDKAPQQPTLDQMFVPAALQLRFQAELNQMDGIQEAERQLNHLHHVRAVTTARNDAATMAQMIRQGMTSSKSGSFDETDNRSKLSRAHSRSASIGGESRSEFEARMKLQLEELLNKRMEKLVEQQTEATRATADAAKQLGRLFRAKRVDNRKLESSQKKSELSIKRSDINPTSRTTTDVSEEILSLMSRAESQIPEVLSLAERTDKSGSSIQRTISEAIRALSVEDHSAHSGDITEDIAAELSSTTTENVPTILEQDKSSKRESTMTSSTTSDKITSSAESFSKFAGKLSDQNVQEQVVRLQHKQHMMSLKEKHLEDLFKLKLDKIEQDKTSPAESVKARKKKLMSEFRQSKAECSLLKESLKSEEKELLFVNSQRKKIDKKELQRLLQQTTADIDLEMSPSPSSISEVLLVKTTDNTSVETKQRSVKEARQRSSSSGPMLKPPLSPKASTSLRRRHSSAESDESFNVSQADTVSDHSDLEIRISALQAELQNRICQAEDLKRQQQKSIKREQLRVQEEALKQQIEAYDNLIVSKRAELADVVQHQHDSLVVVTPKIKTPGVASKSVLLNQVSVDSQDTSQRTISSLSRGSSTDTILPSQKIAGSEDISIDVSSDSLRVEIGGHLQQEEELHDDTKRQSTSDKMSEMLASFDRLSEKQKTFDWLSEKQGSGDSPISRGSSTDTVLESPKKKSFDQIPFSRSLSDEPVLKDVRAKTPEIEPQHSDGEKSEGENSEVQISESIKEDLEETSQPIQSESNHFSLNQSESHRIESNQSDLNYSDDFTSSTASSSSQTSDKNAVIKTTVLLKQQPTANEGFKNEDLFSDDKILKNEDEKSYEVSEKVDEKESQVDNLSSFEVKTSKSVPPDAINKKDALVDEICESMLQDLIGDATRLWSRSKKRQIIEQSKNVEKEFPVKRLEKDPERASLSSPRSGGRSIQDLMHTTFDLGSDTSEESDNGLNDFSSPPLNLDNEKFSEFETGDFIDDDFGLSIRQESEKLRQQQLIIEQEIKRIQQEKAEIPDKPPPPYTPPASPRPLRARPVIENVKHVPSSRSELTNLIPGMLKSLLPTRPNILARLGGRVSFKSKEESGSNVGPSRQKFVTFLLDLVTDIVDEIYRVDSEDQNPPWMPQKPLEKEKRSLPNSEAELEARVTREVLVTFNFEKRAAKENLVVRWSQKRRDRVDQILVRELHSEESAWTDYSADEATVKNQLTEALLDMLLQDTGDVFIKIAEKKLGTR